MTTENENGELRQLLEIKRGYRRDLQEREAQLKAQYESDLLAARSDLKEKYLDNVVDAVFAEPAQVAVEAKHATISIAPQVEVKTEVAPKPAPPPVTSCPECGNTVDANDKFCSQCAYPLVEPAEEKEGEMGEWPVVSAGRKFKPRHR